jgi:putative transposase
VPRGLIRYHQSGHSHFITFSCFHRAPRLTNEAICLTFLHSLERMRLNYRFFVYGYVLMPEHVHLLISEPEVGTIAKVIQALKISVVRNFSGVGTLWQKRYYDHNVRTYESFMNKLRYIHRNPVKRCLCTRVAEWQWSSCRHYATAERGIVEIESEWTADRRQGREPMLLPQS